MAYISRSNFIQFHPDTIECLRKQYDLHPQVRMDEAIDILEEWLKKQNHFVKKTFRRDYLERVIIHNKGSVEKCKKKLDKLCTLKTLIPEYFEDYDEKELRSCDDLIIDHLLPRMTPDHCRVHIFKVKDGKFSATRLHQYFKIFVSVSDYLQAYDYCNGLIYLGDWRDANVMDFAMSVNFADFKKALDIALEGYSMRVKGIHLLTSSKAINAFATILKHALNPKLGERIMVHTSLESIYEHVPMELLPEEYGGSEKPLNELHEDLIRELVTEDFKNYREEINKARTDESCRPKDAFNEYIGMAGTFRNLSVD